MCIWAPTEGWSATDELLAQEFELASAIPFGLVLAACPKGDAVVLVADDTTVGDRSAGQFKDRVRDITRRNRGVSMRQRHLELRRYFQGWVGYFRTVPMKSFFSELDKWVRRRVRSCYWKQWRRPRTRIANLRKLGIREHEAVTHGISSKGPWVMSSSQAVHQALSVDYLRESGLASLSEIWHKLAARKRTA